MTKGVKGCVGENDKQKIMAHTHDTTEHRSISEGDAAITRVPVSG